MEVSKINDICLDISQKAKIDKKVAYGVFRETEDEFSVKSEYISFRKSTPSKAHLDSETNAPFFWVETVLEMLEPSQSVELLLTCKKVHK